MAWECGVCGVKEQQEIKIDAVCHHCGKLLCSKHRIQLVDNAFGNEPGLTGRQAYHCNDCKTLHHPYSRPVKVSAVR